jgi:glutathione S-transferase
MATLTTNLTLYQKNGSCSLVPHALLYHLRLPFQAISMSTDANGKYTAADGSFSHDEYLKLNHTGYVPALAVGDGVIIAEMPAVLTYIASIALESRDSLDVKSEEVASLLGRTVLEKAQIVQWLAYLSGTLHSLGFAALWRPYRAAGDHEEAYAAVREKGREIIDLVFSRIEHQIGGKKYLLGDQLALVDFNIYVFYRWGRELGIDMEKCYPDYSRVARTVEALEGVEKAIKAEELKKCFTTDVAVL